MDGKFDRGEWVQRDDRDELSDIETDEETFEANIEEGVNERDSKLIEDLSDLDDGLTYWERNFILSIDEQHRKGLLLSGKQRATAERILERLS